MDQGTAAVIAAGLGIAGTLGGALGGTWLAGRTALRQVRVQEAADLRHKLRDERRAAFTSCVERRNEVIDNLGRATRAHLRGDDQDSIDVLWEECRERLSMLQGAVAAVEIAGTDEAFLHAAAMADATADYAMSLYGGRPIGVETVRAATQHQSQEALAQLEFIQVVRKELGIPGVHREVE
jgi:hypothetical protein